MSLMKEERKHFVDGLPNAPPLTNEEKVLLDKVGTFKNAFGEKGKRVKGIAKQDVDKFLWNEDGENLGSLHCHCR